MIGSADGNIQCNYHGNDDAWLTKLDSSGNIEWQKCFGGSQNESVIDIIPTDDGGYIFSGQSSSNDGDVSGNHGEADVWVAKLDHWGNLLWQKCYGGSATEFGFVIKKSLDDNYFVGGFTLSNDGDVFGNHSLSPYDADIWLIKIRQNGELFWQQCIGGIGDDGLSDIVELPDGKMMLLGWTDTDNNSGDVNCDHHGPSTWDVWLLSAFDSLYLGRSEIKKENFEIMIFPNPGDQYIKFVARGTDKSSDTFIKIFNRLGQTISTFILQRDGSEIIFDCRELPSGSYYFSYENDQVNRCGQIIIMH